MACVCDYWQVSAADLYHDPADEPPADMLKDCCRRGTKYGATFRFPGHLVVLSANRLRAVLADCTHPLGNTGVIRG